MHRNSPQLLFESIMGAQISFLEEEEAFDEDAPPNCYVIHTQFKHPMCESKDGEPDLGAILNFCLPLSNPWKTGVTEDETVVHEVVFTNEKGEKRYGTTLCFRGGFIVDHLLVDQLELSLIPDKNALASCFCLISPLPVYSIAKSCLREFVQILRSPSHIGEPENYIWWLLHEVIIPPCGPVGSSFFLEKTQTQISFDAQIIPKLDDKMISLLPLFQCLGVGNIVSAISQLLLEQPVIFFSDSYPLLTKITEGIVSLLYPFEWMHVYVPQLPGHRSETVESPGVYIFGLLTKDLEPRLSEVPPETLKVNLDQDILFGGVPGRSSMPGAKKLIQTFRSFFTPGFENHRRGDLGEKKAQNSFKEETFAPILGDPDPDPELERRFNEQMRLTMVSYIAKDLLRNFSDFYNLEAGELDFSLDDYLSGYSDSEKGFMQTFTMTSIFNQFLERYHPRERKNYLDFFTSQLQTFDMREQPILHIDFGTAGTFGEPPLVNTESLKQLSENFQKLTFRTDYFDLLKKCPRNPLTSLIRKLDHNIAQSQYPSVSFQLKWMRASILKSAEKWEAALRQYEEILDQPKILEEVKGLINLLRKKRLLLSFTLPPKILVFVQETEVKRPPLQRLSSHASLKDDHLEDWVKDDIWIKDPSAEEQYGSQSFFRPTDRIVLNELDSSLPKMPDYVGDPLALVTEMLELIISLYKGHSEINDEEEFVFQDQKKFAEMVQMASFGNFTSYSTQLQFVQLGKLSIDEKITFFLNVRTCLGLHTFAEFGVPRSLLPRLGNFQKIVYNIGGNYYSFSDLTYGVLKASMSLPNFFGISFFIPISKFEPSDPRYPYRITEKIINLNFVLFAGTVSQPKAIIFNEKILRRQLKAEAEKYCDQNFIVDKKRKTISIPRGILWFQSDFGKSDREVLIYIFEHLPETNVANFLGSLGQTPRSPLIKGFSIKNTNYLWDFCVKFPDSNLPTEQ